VTALSFNTASRVVVTDGLIQPAPGSKPDVVGSIKTILPSIGVAHRDTAAP